MKSEILDNCIETVELEGLIDHEVDMGFFEKYIGIDGNLRAHESNGCTRINYCSCDCNHNTCSFLVL